MEQLQLGTWEGKHVSEGSNAWPQSRSSCGVHEIYSMNGAGASSAVLTPRASLCRGRRGDGRRGRWSHQRRPFNVGDVQVRANPLQHPAGHQLMLSYIAVPQLLPWAASDRNGRYNVVLVQLQVLLSWRSRSRLLLRSSG